MKGTYRACAVLAALSGVWLVVGIALDWPGRVLLAALVGIVLCGVFTVFIRGEIESERAATIENTPPTFVDPRERADRD